jgi:hypothetical protein
METERKEENGWRDAPGINTGKRATIVDAAPEDRGNRASIKLRLFSSPLSSTATCFGPKSHPVLAMRLFAATGLPPLLLSQ